MSPHAQAKELMHQSLLCCVFFSVLVEDSQEGFMQRSKPDDD